MKSSVKPRIAGALAVLAAGALFAPRPARAQQNPPPPPPAAPAGTPLSDVLAGITRTAGILVVADSSVATQRISVPSLGAVTAGDLETRLAEIVGMLPPGTQWARVYLPATPVSSRWTGDQVADYVYAQSKLFGNVGGATPAGTFEVLGQRVGADRAQALITTLNLKPVYVLTNPARRQAAAPPSAGALGDTSQWAAMSPEQQQQYAQQQAQQLLNNPAQLGQTFQQLMAIRQAAMQQIRQMPPEQRQQLLQGLGAGFGGPGGGGFGGQGGGRGGRRGGNNNF